MILLRKHRLLFLKTRKTAGTSLEIALSAHAAPEDIVTPISPIDELFRLNAGYQFPINYIRDPGAPRVYRQFLINQRQSLDYSQSYPHPVLDFYNHMPWREIAERLDASLPQHLRRVTIVRHPYEVAVSLASFRASMNPETSFEQQLELVCEDVRLDNSLIYRDERGRLPEFVLRYEHLYQDLGALESAIGLELRAKMPYAKSGLRSDSRSAHKILTGQQKERVRQICAFEFMRFGYEP